MYRQTDRMMEIGLKKYVGVRLDCIFNTRWKLEWQPREKDVGCRKRRETTRYTNDRLISPYELKGQPPESLTVHSR